MPDPVLPALSNILFVANSVDDAEKPLGLSSFGRLQVLEPHGAPALWTRFKAALINLPLIGRHEAIRVASEDVRVATNLLRYYRKSAAEFYGAFEDELTLQFGAEIARNAIDAYLAQPGQPGGGLTRRKAELILKEAGATAGNFETSNRAFAANRIRTASVSEGKLSVSHNDPAKDAGGSDVSDIASGITSMQLMATQSGYFRELLTPDQLSSAQPLIAQLQGLESETGLDAQTALAPVLADYEIRIALTPAWNISGKRQIAAECIRVCIRTINASTIAAELRHGPEREATGGSSSSQQRTRTHTNVDEAALTLLCIDALKQEQRLLTPTEVRQLAEHVAKLRGEPDGELQGADEHSGEAKTSPVDQGDRALRQVCLGLSVEERRVLLKALVNLEPTPDPSIHGNGSGESAVRLLVSALSDSLLEHAATLMDETFGAIRHGELPGRIGQLGNAAIEIGWEALMARHTDDAVVAGTLTLVDNDVVLTEPERESPMLQCAEELRQYIKSSSERGNASREEIDTLMLELSLGSLSNLNAGPNIEWLPANGIDEALLREIRGRPQRLAFELRAGYVNRASFKDRSVSTSAIGTNIGQDLEHLRKLASGVEEHIRGFDWPASGGTMAAIDWTKRSLEPVTKELANANPDSLRLEQLEKTARDSADRLLTALAGNSGADTIIACKEAIAATRALRNVRSAAAGDSSRSTSEMLAVRLGQGLEAGTAAARSSNQFLRGREIGALIGALGQAIGLASTQGVPELVPDLEGARDLLQHLRNEATKKSSSSTAASLGDIGSQTQDALSRHFSIAIVNDQVRLTAGSCKDDFTRYVTESAERPLSESELDQVLVGGVHMPRQFRDDLMRSRNMAFRFEDGQPLGAVDDLSSLTPHEREQRLAEAFNRALLFFQKSGTKTRALLAVTNQTTAAAFMVAMANAFDSPVVYGDMGRGVVSPLGINSEEQTTITFSLSEDYAPRAHFSYELRGGVFRLSDPQQPRSVPLDLERSRVKFSMVIEVQGDPPAIKVIGRPRYDVHLVRSPINERFPIPTVEHLSGSDENLYQKLVLFARKQGKNTAADVASVLQLACRANQKEERLADRIRTMGELCEALSRKRSVTRQAPNAVGNLSSTFTELRRQTDQIFDEALASMEAIDLPEQAAEDAHLAQFKEKVAAFKAQPDNATATDALDIFSDYFGIPGSSGQRERSPYFSDAIVASTYSKIQEALNLQNLCFTHVQTLVDALTPTVAQLLPAFSDQLRKEALGAPEFVEAG